MAADFDYLYEVVFVKMTGKWWNKAASKSGFLLELGGLPLSVGFVIVALIVMKFTQWCFESRKSLQRSIKALQSHIKWSGIINYY